MLTCRLSIKSSCSSSFCAWSEMLLYCHWVLTRWFEYILVCIKKTFFETSFIIFVNALIQPRGIYGAVVIIQLRCSWVRIE